MPREIQEGFSVAERDFLAFVIDREGNVILKKAELRPI